MSFELFVLWREVTRSSTVCCFHRHIPQEHTFAEKWGGKLLWVINTYRGNQGNRQYDAYIFSTKYRFQRKVIKD